MHGSVGRWNYASNIGIVSMVPKALQLYCVHSSSRNSVSYNPLPPGMGGTPVENTRKFVKHLKADLL